MDFHFLDFLYLFLKHRVSEFPIVLRALMPVLGHGERIDIDQKQKILFQKAHIIVL